MLRDISLMGLRVRDQVTGFTGVVTSVGFDLYGCVQAVVTPQASEDGKKIEESRWFDTKRLTVLDTVPVMAVPSFEEDIAAAAVAVPGPQDKPRMRRSPLD